MKRSALVLVLCYLVAAAPASAAKRIPQIDKAKAGVAAARKAGKITPADAASYRGILARTAHALPRLSGARHRNLQAVLDDVANKTSEYSGPRALALFSMLSFNTRYFGAKGPPKPKADAVGPGMVVYRYFPGQGLQFHPLADFGALNAHLAAGRIDQARELADSLRDRAVDRGDGASIWEYYFRYAGGKAPWTSGMAQAVAAQALARASQKLNDPTLLDLARRAAAAIPGVLVRQVDGQPWIKLYNFKRAAVLNAQLQAAVSLRDYADIAGDEQMGALADRMTAAAQTLLPKFDTGYWSLYQLGGAEETRSYHDYVIFLLNRLKGQTKDPFWGDTAARFKSYDTQPPVFASGPPAAVVAPAEKGTASSKLTFWLSKRSSVVVRVGSKRKTLWLSHGWHTLHWKLPRSKPGIFPVSLQAAPIAGPRSSATLLPVVVLGKPAKRGLASARDRKDAASLVVGAAENAVLSADAGTAAAQLGLATSLGMQAVRVAIPWSPGQAAPDPGLLGSLQTTAQQAAASGVRLYLEVYPASPEAAPVDAGAQAQFAGYLQAVAAAVPQIRDFVVGSQVNSSAFWPQGPDAAATYLGLLAASYDALKAVDPATRVIGASLSGRGTPATWILDLGKAYKRSGRTTPIMDALAIQPWNDTASQPPSFVHAKGSIGIADYPRLVANLKRAFAGTAQPGATLPIVYDGYGVQTQVPPEKAGLYTETETDAVDEQTQGAYYAQALLLASCQPTVSALLVQHTVDERDLTGWQSGLYYPDLTPKSDAEAFRGAVASLRAGALGLCPTPAPAPAPSAPATPASPAAPAGPAAIEATVDGATATLSCDRACYYVAVLTDARDVPVAAQKGQLGAADGETAVTVPTDELPPGTYSLQVHVVPRSDPGDGAVEQGDPFAVG